MKKSSKNLMAFLHSLETGMPQENQLAAVNSRQKKSFLDSLIILHSNHLPGKEEAI